MVFQKSAGGVINCTDSVDFSKKGKNAGGQLLNKEVLVNEKSSAWEPSFSRGDCPNFCGVEGAAFAIRVVAAKWDCPQSSRERLCRISPGFCET